MKQLSRCICQSKLFTEEVVIIKSFGFGHEVLFEHVVWNNIFHPSVYSTIDLGSGNLLITFVIVRIVLTKRSFAHVFIKDIHEGYCVGRCCYKTQLFTVNKHFFDFVQSQFPQKRLAS
jgi:hypothetical protein